MEEKFLNIEELDLLLKKWTGKQITISKLEQKDLDEVNILLDNVSYEKNTKRHDDYEALYTLKLNGQGVIDTDVNEAQPLPEPDYEIALDSKAMYEFEDEEVMISTERAVYKIRLV